LTTINQRHFTEEVTLRKFRQGHLILFFILDTYSHATTLNQIHRVAFFTVTKETGISRDILF
jgi:hypothetical protein